MAHVIVETFVDRMNNDTDLVIHVPGDAESVSFRIHRSVLEEKCPRLVANNVEDHLVGVIGIIDHEPWLIRKVSHSRPIRRS
jgi:hypothetical protein